MKRDAETSDETDSDSDSTSSTKRARRSLGISSTCDKLEAVGIASNSEEEIESLREASSSDNDSDISQLLENTEPSKDLHHLIEEAWGLVDEIADEIPDLTTSSGDSESDSGNSETNWGFVRRYGRGRHGVMWTGSGEEVPVTLGKCTCSSEGEEIMRIRRSLILLDTSGSFENSDDELRVSTSDSSSSEPESIHFVWDGGIVRYLDDEIINRQGGEEEYELRVSTPDSSSVEPGSIHSVWDGGMVKYLDDEIISHQGVEEE